MEMQVFDFEEPLKFNVIEFEEKGNKVDLVKVEALLGGEMKEIYRQDEMGNRVAVIDPIETTKVQVTISASEKGVTIKKVKFSFVEFLVRENKLNVSAYMAGPFSDGLLNSFDERLAVTTEIILIGYINFDDKGNLVHRNGYEFLDRDIAALKEGIKQQNAKTKILMCFGNFEGEKENADKVFSTKEIRANFIKQAIDFIKKYDLDGADIDFEYPANKKQWDGYSKVLVEFKKELLKLNLPLSIALPSWGVELSAEAIKAVDEVQMMQYDLFDEKRRHAPFEVFAYGIEYFQKIGFPKEKLYPGLALYGREKDVNAEERWLSYEGICMMYDLIDANTNEMDNSYFTGKTMNRDKTFYALLKGCGGIMLFQYACDLPFENELSIFRGVSEIINGFVKIEAP
ncbi:MAG: glycoside hydrolase family 18 protein, partial [Clostridia bacterium]